MRLAVACDRDEERFTVDRGQSRSSDGEDRSGSSDAVKQWDLAQTLAAAVSGHSAAVLDDFDRSVGDRVVAIAGLPLAND